MHKFKNEIGNKYNKLLVLEKTDKRSHGFIIWKCKCDCGTIVEVMGSSLRSGNTKSCGCHFRLTRFKTYIGAKADFSAKKHLYTSIIQKAKYRGISFNIDKDNFYKLSEQNCYYCNCSPVSTKYSNSKKGSYKYNGLDRVNNNIGYTLDNVVPCCFRCNASKGQETQIDFFERLKRIVIKHSLVK